MSTVEVPDSSFTIELDHRHISAGQTIQGHVRIKNLSKTHQLNLDIGRRVGVVLNLDETLAGAFPGGATTGTDRVVDLSPSSELTLGFRARSTSNQSLGRVDLPAGNYLVVVILQIYGEGRIDKLAIPPVPIKLEDFDE